MCSPTSTAELPLKPAPRLPCRSTDTMCAICYDDPAVCASCAGPGWGQDKSNGGLCTRCVEPGCTTCDGDHTACTYCTEGFRLNQGKCEGEGAEGGGAPLRSRQRGWRL